MERSGIALTPRRLRRTCFAVSIAVAGLAQAQLSSSLRGGGPVSAGDKPAVAAPAPFAQRLEAAKGGDPAAQCDVGDAYLAGQGVARDPTEAVRWYLKAAQRGHAQAQFRMGVCADRGDGVAQDKAEAVRWYRAAADQGVTSALFNLGMMAWRGEGMEKSAEASIGFHRRAAEAGHAKSQLVLGRMLLNGQGAPPDKAEAVRWLRASARQGFDLARQELEKLGEPVPAVAKAPAGEVAAAPAPAPGPAPARPEARPPASGAPAAEDVLGRQRPAAATPVATSAPTARPAAPAGRLSAGASVERRPGARPRALPAMPPAELGPVLDIKKITDADYAGAVSAGEAGARMLFGPMRPEEEKEFAAKWSPMYRFPYAECIEYLNQFNPLVSQFAAAKTGFNEAALAYDRAQLELVMACACEGEADLPVILDELDLQMELMKSFGGRMRLIGRQVAALGGPPDLSALLARARKGHDDAMAALLPADERRYLRVDWGEIPKELSLVGTCHQRRKDGKPGKVTRRFVPLSSRIYLGWNGVAGLNGDDGTEAFAEKKAGFGLRILPGEFRSQNEFEQEYVVSKEGWPGQYGGHMNVEDLHYDTLQIDGHKAYKVEYFAKTGFEKLGRADAYYRVQCFIESGHPHGAWTSHSESPEWVAFEFLGTYWTAQQGRQVGYEPVEEMFARFRGESSALHARWKKMVQTVVEGLKVESVASVPPADRNSMAFLDDESGKALPAVETEAELIARLKREREEKERKEAAESMQKKIAGVQADIQYFSRTLENLKRDLEKVDPRSRDTVRGQILVAEADLQRAQDEMTALRTGTFVRTPTRWDAYNESMMREQSRQIAETLDANHRRMERMDRMIALADESERDRLRDFWNRTLTRSLPAGDYDQIEKAAGAIFKTVSGTHEREAARQEEAAIKADARMAYAQNVKTISDYSLAALGMVASAGQGGTFILRSLTMESGISTLYSMTTGYIEKGPEEAVKTALTSYSDVAGLFSMAMDSYHDAVLTHLEQHAVDPGKVRLDETGAGIRGVVWALGTEGAKQMAVNYLVNPVAVMLRERMGWNPHARTASGGINWPETRSPFGRGGGGRPPAGATAGLPVVPKVNAPGVNWDLGTGNGKWPTTRELMLQADFESRRANGRAMVNLLKQRNEALVQAAENRASAAELGQLRRRVEESYRAIKNDFHAKAVLKRAACQDPDLVATYNAIDRQHTGLLLNKANEVLGRQGIAAQELQPVRNSCSCGSASMDLDVTHREPARWTTDAQGRKIPNPEYARWRNGLTQTLPDGTVVHLTPHQYRTAAQEALRQAYREVHGREPVEAFLNFTDSGHPEAYKDRYAWTGERTDRPHADFPSIDPQWAAQAGDVTAFKVRDLPREHPSLGTYSALLENSRGLAKDFESKLFGSRPEPSSFGPTDYTLAVHPDSPLADRPAAVRQHFQALYSVIKEFSEDKISPIQAERRIRQLTGGRGVAEVADQMKVVFEGIGR